MKEPLLPFAGQRLNLRHRVQNRQRPDCRSLLFRADHCPNVIWTDLNKLNLSEGAPVLTLNPNNIDLSGDVTSQFQPAKASF
jgi:hypothetical protein